MEFVEFNTKDAVTGTVEFTLQELIDSAVGLSALSEYLPEFLKSIDYEGMGDKDYTESKLHLKLGSIACLILAKSITEMRGLNRGDG